MRGLMNLGVVALMVGCKEEPEPSPDNTVAVCTADAVPVEATQVEGWREDGTFISAGGRLVAPAGPSTLLDSMPIDIVLHPSGLFAYVPLAERGTRLLAVVDLDRLETIQVLDQDFNHHGIVVDPDGDRLFAAGGGSGTLEVFDILDDGTLAAAEVLEISDNVAGVAMSDDGALLWVGDFGDDVITELDVETLAVTRTIPLSVGVWDIVHLPGRQELYVSDLSSDGIAVVDLDAGEEAAVIDVPTSPAGLVASTDEATVYAAVSNGDVVVAIDADSRAVSQAAQVTEDDLLDSDGLPLPNSNVTAVALDASGQRLFAARGSDNAISVLDADTLERLGAFPSAMYPTELVFAPDGQLVIVEYKGAGMSQYAGSLTVVDVGSLDLDATTAEVSRLYASPTERYPFSCDDFFPIPSKPGQTSPIEHVVLVVKENKTLDCLFGDMELEDFDVDPEFLRWPPEATVNQRALIREFNIADNFYVDTVESDSGHLFLTSTHLTHYTEWLWSDSARGNASISWPLADINLPTVGNFFTHLLNEGKTIQIYGEIVGTFAEADDGTSVADFADFDYPGGNIVNYGVRDTEKAEYVVEQIQQDGLADFTYILFPNDHTNGTTPGFPTPESMVADNDRAVGVLVEGISNQAELWEKTAIFILQDDPQGCNDHVADTRSMLIVASPYAKRGGYVSHTNTNFLSVFATIERILGVPAIGRPDAVAVPLWNTFQPKPDTTPFTAQPLGRPEQTNSRTALGAQRSRKMDFSGPDRSPELTPLLDAYGLMILGRISREEAEERLAQPRLSADEALWEELEEESEEEITAYDQAWSQYEAWAKKNGRPAPIRPLSKTPSP